MQEGVTGKSIGARNAAAVVIAAFSIPPFRLPIYAACTLVALATNYVLGKDMASDTLNYHLYAGFSVFNARLEQDYFAAGPQSYLVPYAYAPFYLLVRSGASSLFVTSILAILHSAMLWLIFEFALLVHPTPSVPNRTPFAIVAVALAFINPIFMQQIGSSFADITTAEVVLAGWLLLTRSIERPSFWQILWAGIAVGGATALKLTNAVYAIASIPMFFFLPLSINSRIRYALSYCAIVAVSFCFLMAPWAMRLWHMFRNPVFPLFNDIFRSPEYSTQSLLHFRFIPANFAEALMRPFDMARPEPMIHEELMAPDLRYAFLFLLALVFIITYITRLRKSLPKAARPPRPLVCLLALMTSLGCAWVIWLRGSGNSRYFLPMGCLTGVVLAALVFQIFEKSPKARNYLLVIIFSGQLLQLYLGTEYRWNKTEWDRTWMDISVPTKLQQEANLFLSIGMLSNSFVAPYVDSRSALVNFAGGYTLSPNTKNGERIRTLIARYSPNLRVLLTGKRLFRENELRSPTTTEVNDALIPWKLRVDESDCSQIAVHDLPPGLEITFEGAPSTYTPPDKTNKDTTYLTTCRLIPDLVEHPDLDARRREVNIVLDRLEDSCPDLFQPRRPETEHAGKIWMRRYGNTDLTAWVSRGQVKMMQPIRGASAAFVGLEKDWRIAPQSLECGKADDIYFARPVR